MCQYLGLTPFRLWPNFVATRHKMSSLGNKSSFPTSQLSVEMQPLTKRNHKLMTKLSFTMGTSRRCLQHILGLICSVTLALPAMATITLLPYPEAYICKNSSIGVSAETDCEGGGISLTAPGGVLFLTGGGSSISGTYGSGSTPGDVILSASDNCNDSVSAIIHVMEITHECVATIPVNRSRGLIGVGEQVNLGLGGSSVNASWSTSAGSLSQSSGSSTTLTAPETGGSATVTCSFPDGNICTYVFTVLAPSSMSMSKVSGSGQANPLGVQLQSDVYVGPESVNLSAVTVAEQQCNANCNGYFAAYQQGLVHNPGADAGVTTTLVAGKGWKLGITDNISGGTRGATYSGGDFTWAIPIHYKINGHSYYFTTKNHIKELSIGGSGKATLTLTKGSASHSQTEP